MKRHENFIALATGVLFGLGLGIAQMIDPNKIQNFLDVSGSWDASLMFVLGGAVVTTLVAFRYILRQSQPRFADTFHLPVPTQIDRKLILGAVIFGVGWGLAGYCPGPAFAALALGGWEPLVFLPAMALGFALHRWVAVEEKGAVMSA